MKQNTQIESAIQNGYTFNTGDYFNKGLEIFKKNPGGYIGFIIVLSIISSVINMIPVVGAMLNLIVNPPLTVGIAMGAHKQESEGSEEFGNFFNGFDHIVQLFIANVLMLIIYLVIASPLIFLLGFSVITAYFSGDNNALFETFTQVTNLGVSVFIVLFLCAFVAISLRWTNYFIVFYKYDAIEAIKTSWKLVNKNWFSHLGFAVLAFLAMIGGLIALIIGIIFVVPIVYAADYAAFAHITGLNEKRDVIDEIGEDLV
jgi:hypothetical protein